LQRLPRISVTAAVAAVAAVALAVSGAQAAGTPGWRFTALFPQADQITSVSATGATNAWAVGQTGTLSLFVSQWTGRKWRVLALPKEISGGSNPIVFGASVAAIAGERAWVFVGKENDELGTQEVDAMEWTGTSWSAVHTFAGQPSLGPAVATGPGDVWDFGSENGTPWVVRYNGKSWSRVLVPLTSPAASGGPAAGVWLTGTAAAQPARVAIVHWSKGAWRNAALPKISVPAGDQVLPGDIAAATAADVWATVGVGPVRGRGPVAITLLHWNGKAWSKVAVPKGVNLAGLASDGHGGAWLTSQTTDKSFNITGLVMYHYSAGRWTHAPGPAKAGCQYSVVGHMELIPGTRSVLENADLFACPNFGFYGAVLKYGP
jgi:hypothetical protein